MKSTNREGECKILYLDESNLTNEKNGDEFNWPKQSFGLQVREKAPPPPPPAGVLGVS
jgi:hypothetical protein